MHLAVRSLREKESDAAIVGGVNAILSPETTLAFSQAQMLSPEGKCRPFDHRANGYVRGEGCGIVILKRLSDAVKNNDLVLGTICGTAINQDGLTSGITAPRGTAQIDVIRKALRDAKKSVDDVSYIEAHGTGTPLGDPIEVNSLAEVFRKSDNAGVCHFGSAKANIGHTETASGIAALIKTLLMFKHRIIPGQTHFQRINPHIDLDGSRLQVPSEPAPWENGDKPLVCGVSSFGFGGANAHVVLEAPGEQAPKEFSVPDRNSHVLTLSAKSPESLREVAARYHDTLSSGAFSENEGLADSCFTAAVGRSHMSHRAAIHVNDAGQLQDGLSAVAAGEKSRHVKIGKARSDRPFGLAFLFPGQGAQFPGMGRQLYEAYPAFRDALDECDQILAEHMPHRLLDILFEDQGREPLVHQTQFTQPALFAIEYATSRLWRSFGLEYHLCARLQL